MFSFALALLLFSTCFLRNFVDTTTSENEANTSLATCFYDDDILKNITHQLEVLNLAVENLRLKLDIYNMKFEQEFAKQKQEFLNTETLLEQEHATNNIEQDLLIDKTSAAAMKSRSCAEALNTNAADGIYEIYVNRFNAYCLKDPENKGRSWTVIQRRQNGKTDFNRNWKDYKAGFGNLTDEFFIGLDKLHALTQDQLHELWIEMEDFNGNKRYARYASFAIGNEASKYALDILGSYTGTAGDSLRAHHKHKFSTKDSDNDDYSGDCAKLYEGAWWYYHCTLCNLNGPYLSNGNYNEGIFWNNVAFQFGILKYVQMAIRPVK